MPCYTRYADGGNQFLCGKLGPHCVAESCNWVSDFLCDYPVGNDKTCDRSLCGDHAHQIAPDTHYCAAHYNEYVEYRNTSELRNTLDNVVPFKKI